MPGYDDSGYSLEYNRQVEETCTRLSEHLKEMETNLAEACKSLGEFAQSKSDELTQLVEELELSKLVNKLNEKDKKQKSKDAKLLRAYYRRFK